MAASGLKDWWISFARVLRRLGRKGMCVDGGAGVVFFSKR